MTRPSRQPYKQAAYCCFKLFEEFGLTKNTEYVVGWDNPEKHIPLRFLSHSTKKTMLAFRASEGWTAPDLPELQRLTDDTTLTLDMIKERFK
eukprot:gnl/MRDRNA2_/MRDRNA2_1175675_c0_seq1.p1 gnl/MRDRNA2_/MRDRNA2_1175675_c0~~gnl/MRDRNA2_/MRDRNA2_1175675_c0_seq1.p1  ORF type:complete len:102 (+),score=13.79 gnl/MRDRNA2_/MRDRNA2_1175675_c0_seq1:32-307(+)